MERNAPEFGRFTEPSLLILVSLSDGPKHGYAIMQDVEAGTGRPMGAGTLYAALARLEDEGFVEPLAPVDRRRPYRLTAIGASMLAEQLRGLSEFAQQGLRQLARARTMRRLLIRCYPARWRARYGDEFLALLEERPLGPYDVPDILLGALDARLRSQRAAGSTERGLLHVASHRRHRRHPRCLTLAVSWFGTLFGALPFDGRFIVGLTLDRSRLAAARAHDPERVPGSNDAGSRVDRLHAVRHRRASGTSSVGLRRCRRQRGRRAHGQHRRDRRAARAWRSVGPPPSWASHSSGSRPSGPVSSRARAACSWRLGPA